MGKHATHKKSDKYTVDAGKVVRQGRFCPKCGPGVVMARHSDRFHCGKCGYTEFLKRNKLPAQPVSDQ
ncbi:MAG TPA: 30S ribosomal protein S27ae [archaeon]|nr:30S ribosomal protein S27ae [archaeon]